MKTISLIRKIVLLCSLFLAGHLLVSAQIKAPQASFTGETTNQNYFIFVFCDSGNTSNVGELEVSSPDATDGWTFTWKKYDSGIGGFPASSFQSDLGSSSKVDGLLDGGYQVVVEKGAESYTYLATVINNFNEVSKFDLVSQDCDGLKFETGFTAKDYTYLNLLTGSDASLNIQDSDNRFALFREQEVDGDPIPEAASGSVSLVDKEAFNGKENYTVHVTDKYNCTWVSGVIQAETHVASADIEVNQVDTEAPLSFNDVNDLENKNTIKSDSKNASSYQWLFYNDFEEIERTIVATSLEDSLLVDVIREENPGLFTYEHPGRYFIKLIVESDEGCVSEYMTTTTINVDSSLLEVPNVFTPNGDGINDEFMMKDVKSLKSFHAIIFNRWGRVVYEWRDAKEGWDGRVNGKKASPGTYFYVITAVGTEAKRKMYTKKGSLTLLR